MKTRKAKCLGMYEYFEMHPTHKKEDYRQYLIREGRAGEYSECWACDEATKRSDTTKTEGDTCYFCPINWHPSIFKTSTKISPCMDVHSPYRERLTATTIPEALAAIKKIITLIKTTWEEE